MHPGDIEALFVSRGDLVDDLVEGQRRGIDHPRAGRRGSDDRPRHQRAGIKADRAAFDQPQPAHRDQIRRARPGADEMHRHRGEPLKYPRGV